MTNQTTSSRVENFRTARLCVQNWTPLLEDGERRRDLEHALTRILTPLILEHLPGPLQLSKDQSALSDWVSARAAESEVYVVFTNDTNTLIGLLILAGSPEPAVNPSVHLGYLLAEDTWGKGYATELVSGLVTSLESGPQVHLIGGVDKGNTASARVLQKVGFNVCPKLSTTETDMFVYTDLAD